MNSLRKTVISVAAIVTAAALLSFASPRTVHALGEEQVIVMNPAIRPAIVEEVTHFASHLVTLVGNVPSSAFGAPFLQQTSNGVIPLVAFVVPVGQSLVITSVEISPWTNASTWINIESYTQGWFAGWTVPGTVSTQFQLPSGIVVGSGVELALLANLGVSVVLHGYLTTE
jgi:hypothetical protein